MKLHPSAIEEFVRLYESYGGHRNELKLKDMLSRLDLSVYERQSGEKIIVTTDELNKEKSEKIS